MRERRINKNKKPTVAAVYKGVATVVGQQEL